MRLILLTYWSSWNEGSTLVHQNYQLHVKFSVFLPTVFKELLLEMTGLLGGSGSDFVSHQRQLTKTNNQRH